MLGNYVCTKCLPHPCLPEARSREEGTDKVCVVFCYHTYVVEKLMPYYAPFLFIFEIFHFYFYFGRQAG